VVQSIISLKVLSACLVAPPSHSDCQSCSLVLILICRVTGGADNSVAYISEDATAVRECQEESTAGGPGSARLGETSVSAANRSECSEDPGK
jgi:hypothetical protein